MKRTVFPRLRTARAELDQLLTYAANSNLHALRAGEALDVQRTKNKALTAENADLKRAIQVLAGRLALVHAYLGHLDGDTAAEAAVARMPLVGVLDAEYVHKLTGDRIRLVERTGSRDWAYVAAGSSVRWAIFDDDLGNEFTRAEEVTQPLSVGGGS